MTARLPDAVEHFERVTARIADRRPALFLDFDGTLSPIVERPEDARLAPGLEAVLRRLAAKVPVAVVSGRDRADVERKVGLEGIAYAGSHGHDTRTASGRRLPSVVDEGALEALAEAARQLERDLAGVPGARVERKQAALAVHWREVAAARVGEVEAAARRADDAHPDLRLRRGRRIFELVPAVDWDKGRAVDWLLDHLELDRDAVLPIYLGDDVTDEDAFARIAPEGLGILVGDLEEREGDRDTAATLRLADPAAVGTFLERLDGWLERQGATA